MSSILLIQSDPAESARLRTLLDTDSSMAVSGIADTLAQARESIARRMPDLLISDLRLSDGPLVDLIDGLRPGRSHVMVLAASVRDPQLIHALRNGADGYLLGATRQQDVLASVRRVLAGESPIDSSVARQILAYVEVLGSKRFVAGAHGRLYLSELEHRMLDWVGEGYLPEEVARCLEITPAQIGLLVRSVYRRMHADMRIRRSSAPAA